MYEYSVIWIKEDIAKHYFHKSDILYRFIKAYQKNHDRTDLKKQYDYITNDFPETALISHMKKYLNNVSVQVEGPQIKLNKNLHLISLHISEKHLKFRCETLQDAEETLFPILRQFQSILFIIGNNIENYGWISPVPCISKY